MEDAMTGPLGFSVRAYNTATDSRNRMHDNIVARSYGFEGGLVPGVVLLAYLAHPPIAQWGMDWLSEGSISTRFSEAVYHGDEVSIGASLNEEAEDYELVLTLTGGDGRIKVSGTASARSQIGQSDVDPDAPEPTTPMPPPAASPDSLREGTVLAPWSQPFRATQSLEYLSRIGAPTSDFTEQRVAQPGWFAELANSLLSSNVAIGPWIHVSSDIALAGPVSDGQLVITHGVVRDEYERKGHRFVVLDCVLTEGKRRVAEIVHTAIYSPRLAAPT